MKKIRRSKFHDDTSAPLTASARVVASKGAAPRYTVKWYPIDPTDKRADELREKQARIAAQLAYIDVHPHRDPVWRPVDLARYTPAALAAATARAAIYRVEMTPDELAMAERQEQLERERDAKLLASEPPPPVLAPSTCAPAPAQTSARQIARGARKRTPIAAPPPGLAAVARDVAAALERAADDGAIDGLREVCAAQAAALRACLTAPAIAPPRVRAPGVSYLADISPQERARILSERAQKAVATRRARLAAQGGAA